MAKAILDPRFAAPGHAKAPTRLRIITKYTSVAEFIRGFWRALDHEHLLVGFRSARPCGSLWRFSVCLADGTPAFEGLGRIVEIILPRDRRGGVGARLELLSVESESRTMHRSLLLARDASERLTSVDDAPFDDTRIFARGTLPPEFRMPLPLLPPGPDDDETLYRPAAVTQQVPAFDGCDSGQPRLFAMPPQPAVASEPSPPALGEPERVAAAAIVASPLRSLRIQAALLLMIAVGVVAATSAGLALLL